jgi:preprotein translocase subunit SecA
MLTWVAKKFFGTANDRALKKCQPKVEAINALEPAMKKLSDAELKAKTPEFKGRIDKGESLDSLLVEAYAAAREASVRALGMRHYDVQLVGGMTLHNGAIAEMKTGEGKTLVATLPVYLNALEGKGVHVVTVNDYLATRDAEWMGKLYNWMGLSIGTVVNNQAEPEKIRAYKADICYGQNNEFGFDYLRDNMKFSALEYAQRPLNYAIIDEVDSILIDEARTPLIISGHAEASSQKYHELNDVIPKLRRDEHYTVDEKAFSVTPTDDGIELAQQLVGVDNLYDPANLESLHILNQLLRAHALYKRDQHYMVTRDGKVQIIDEFTGRVLAGRRWSDGLHQAVEAKENVRIQEESRTVATITFQNLFRLYDKLSGMTGTAVTEAPEFHSTYKLDVVTIPTNKPLIRNDVEDVVYKTEREKFTAAIKDITETHERGQPVLVGTTSVEKSAAVSRILKKKNIPHNVLNAKHHENEAFVVAQAGQKGAITVSTNMAGRGTDIVLGGNPEMLARFEFHNNSRMPEAEPDEFEALVEQFSQSCEAEQKEVLSLGGLHILGTERHESRRIDNQLRGRASRQGDPGSSKFYLSLEDDLMRIFAGDRVKNLMDRMGMPDDEPIEHPWVTKSVENAQRKVEERNFDVRKNVLEYDDVMNAQRKTIYGLRQQLLIGRYEPEEVDELGKPTGGVRKIKADPEIAKQAEHMAAQLVVRFAEDPVQLFDENGEARMPTRDDIIKIEKFVELPVLQHEIYQFWGVKIDIDERRNFTPLELFDELVELVGHGLTEQRERLFDLTDRVASAMVEESCIPNKPPEDWDWKGLRTGFNDHFKQTLDPAIEDLGQIEEIAQRIYEQAESIYNSKESALGLELSMRYFRHYYLEEIDRAWVDHLSSMEHLRDGIGLRGYGQKDPKQEYKKEGYNLFVDMMASISSNVVERHFTQAASQSAEQEIAALEAEAAERHHAELESAVARHVGEPSPESEAVLSEQMRQAAASVSPGAPQSAPAAPPPPAAARIGRNDECPCGSGKKFKKCHGAGLDDDEAVA